MCYCVFIRLGSGLGSAQQINLIPRTASRHWLMELKTLINSEKKLFPQVFLNFSERFNDPRTIALSTNWSGRSLSCRRTLHLWIVYHWKMLNYSEKKALAVTGSHISAVNHLWLGILGDDTKYTSSCVCGLMCEAAPESLSSASDSSTSVIRANVTRRSPSCKVQLTPEPAARSSQLSGAVKPRSHRLSWVSGAGRAGLKLNTSVICSHVP